MSSTVQAAIATSNALHDIESGHLPTALTGSDNNDKTGRFDVVTILTLALGIGSIILNLLAMIFSYETAPVLAMGVVALLVAPVIMYRQVGMDKDAMRNLQNLLRENVNSLSVENVRLCKEVNEFGAKVQSLKKYEDELATLATDSKQDVDTLVELVKENEKIMAELKEAAVAQAIQKVIDSFLDSDRDASSSLDEQEIRMLIDMRLKPLENVKINEQVLENKLKEDSSLAGILAVLRASLMDDVAPENKVFDFDQ